MKSLKVAISKKLEIVNECRARALALEACTFWARTSRRVPRAVEQKRVSEQSTAHLPSATLPKMQDLPRADVQQPDPALDENSLGSPCPSWPSMEEALPGIICIMLQVVPLFVPGFEVVVLLSAPSETR